VEDWRYDVFISYNRKDDAFVNFLEQSLELSGLRCFRDRTGLGIYDKLDAALKRAISQSRWLMAVISPAYLQSYWCLFEALEAIQGQGLTKRFLPLVLRNNPEDQVLDENFVLSALHDLREQIRIFETQMVAERAFMLAEKLDKLAFVQNQLPKIFSLIGERIYPQFQLWDEDAVRSTMRELIAYLAPQACPDVDAIPLLIDIGVWPTLVIPTVQGHVLLIRYSDISIDFGEAKSVTVCEGGDENAERSSSFHACESQPCLAGNLILQGMVRDTYYEDPPLVAIDPALQAVRWTARAGAGDNSFGNLRSPPVIAGDEAIFATAYSSELCAVSLSSGVVTWRVDLGQSLFEQWAGPIVAGRSIFIGRHDGYLHKVSSERRRREWSIYVGDENRAGAVVVGTQQVPEFTDSQAWSAGASSPILATPALDRGSLYVGTHQGWLYCIGNLGGDTSDF
jgi:hypothetical protein